MTKECFKNCDVVRQMILYPEAPRLIRALGLDSQGFNRLRQMDGDTEDLGWLQVEKKRGKPITNELLRWFRIHKIRAKDILFIVDRMSPLQIRNYLQKQKKYFDGSCRQALITWQDYTARRTYRQTRAMQIWQVETDVSGYFEPYHLRYPGEVLERFEEKLGNDVRVLRALALALGNTCAIQSDNMFVGNQRGAFLQKLRRSAGEDVYLQGALYLLETDAAQRHALLEKLAERECMRKYGAKNISMMTATLWRSSAGFVKN